MITQPCGMTIDLWWINSFKGDMEISPSTTWYPIMISRGVASLKKKGAWGFKDQDPTHPTPLGDIISLSRVQRKFTAHRLEGQINKDRTLFSFHLHSLRLHRLIKWETIPMQTLSQWTLDRAFMKIDYSIRIPWHNSWMTEARSSNHQAHCNSIWTPKWSSIIILSHIMDR